MMNNKNFIKKARIKIDEYDNQIISLISKRIKVCQEIGVYKKYHDISMMQPTRVNEVIERCIQLAKQHQLNPKFIENLFKAIITETCRIENEIIKQPY